MQRLHDLLKNEHPIALPQIERALASQCEMSADQEAVLSALIWRRCTDGGARLLGTVLYQDCANRIGNLSQHLRTIGARDAATAVYGLRDEILLEDEQMEFGLLDWIETEPGVVRRAKELGDSLEDIDQILWDFMKRESSDIPDLQVPTRTQQYLSSMRNWLRPNPGKQ